jgi:hypothetical protein
MADRQNVFHYIHWNREEKRRGAKRREEKRREEKRREEKRREEKRREEKRRGEKRRGLCIVKATSTIHRVVEHIRVVTLHEKTLQTEEEGNWRRAKKEKGKSKVV